MRYPRAALRGLGVALLSSVLIALLSCAANPVTGKRELHLVSGDQEIQTGAENYQPSRQSQGGDYTVDQELTDYVRTIGQKLAKASDRAELPYEFAVLNNSVPNAWALPGGKIAVNRGLLYELHSEAELAAVLGHEITHAAARHGAKAMERGMLLQVGVVGLGAALGDKEGGDLLVGAGALGAQLIGKKYGREAELEADHYGMIYLARAGYDPHAAIALQETFVKLSQGERPHWLAGLFATHPPSPERVEENRKTASQLPAGGKVGTEEWNRKTAHLTKTKPAYAKLDQGRKALAEKNPEKALALAEEAIQLEPREGLFYGLRGDAKTNQKRYQEALADYELAIARNGEFFQFYLQRGLVKQQLNDVGGAGADLKKSLSLLPTAVAHYALGEIALKRPDRESAKQHFAAAAQSESLLGNHAAVELARLDIVDHPEKYIAARAVRDPGSFINVTIQNLSPVKLRNIKIAVALFNKTGQMTGQESVTFAQVIEARKTASSSTRLGPVITDQDLQRVRVKLFSAEIAE